MNRPYWPGGLLAATPADRDVMRDSHSDRAHAERHEHGAALGVLTEAQRVTDCPHDYRRGVCWHCGDDEPRKDRNA